MSSQPGFQPDRLRASFLMEQRTAAPVRLPDLRTQTTVRAPTVSWQALRRGARVPFAGRQVPSHNAPALETLASEIALRVRPVPSCHRIVYSVARRIDYVRGGSRSRGVYGQPRAARWVVTAP